MLEIGEKARFNELAKLDGVGGSDTRRFPKQRRCSPREPTRVGWCTEYRPSVFTWVTIPTATIHKPRLGVLPQVGTPPITATCG